MDSALDVVMPRKRRGSAPDLPPFPVRLAEASRWRRILRHVCYMSIPLVVASLYLAFNAAPRYDAESDFTVLPLVQPGTTSLLARNAAHLTDLAQPTAPGAYDAYMVMDYLQSPAALQELERRVGFLARYRAKTRDIFYRPEPWRLLIAHPLAAEIIPIPFEDQVDYYNQMVQLRYSMTENIVTLDVQAFTPEDAAVIASALLAMGEAFINHGNQRVVDDLVRSSEAQVALDQQRLNADHLRINDWRAGNSDLDPDQLTALVTAVIQGLENSLVATRAEVMQNAFASDSPVRHAAELRVTALEDQIAREQRHLADMERAFATKYFEYDRLKEDIEFAKNAYQTDLAAVQTFRELAEQQGIYLQRIYDPHRPDKAAYPEPWLILPLTFLGGAMAYGLLRMILALGRERAR
jgi:capsular polysaccharide transport system permease protein